MYADTLEKIALCIHQEAQGLGSTSLARESLTLEEVADELRLSNASLWEFISMHNTKCASSCSFFLEGGSLLIIFSQCFKEK